MPMEPREVRLTVSIRQRDYDALVALARKLDSSLSAAVRYLIDNSPTPIPAPSNPPEHVTIYD